MRELERLRAVIEASRGTDDPTTWGLKHTARRDLAMLAPELLAVVARAERVKGFCESESVTLYDPAGGKPCGTCRFCALRTALDALDARIAALPDGGDHG